jgi:predicted nucleic acid-binding protein
MTVLDTSGVVDFLLGADAATEVEALVAEAAPVAATDLIVFETLAVLRRLVQRGDLDAWRAQSAVDDLGDFPLELFPSMTLRGRAFELRDSLTTADALFVALAELLEEPLATKDRRLAETARLLTGIEVIDLAG